MVKLANEAWGASKEDKKCKITVWKEKTKTLPLFDRCSGSNDIDSSEKKLFRCRNIPDEGQVGELYPGLLPVSALWGNVLTNEPWLRWYKIGSARCDTGEVLLGKSSNQSDKLWPDWLLISADKYQLGVWGVWGHMGLTVGLWDSLAALRHGNSDVTIIIAALACINWPQSSLLSSLFTSHDTPPQKFPLTLLCKTWLRVCGDTARSVLAVKSLHLSTKFVIKCRAVIRPATLQTHFLCLWNFPLTLLWREGKIITLSSNTPPSPDCSVLSYNNRPSQMRLMEVQPIRAKSGPSNLVTIQMIINYISSTFFSLRWKIFH